MFTCITSQAQAAAFIDGMVNGGIGVALIIFGLLGWPRTANLLRALFRNFHNDNRPTARSAAIEDKLRRLNNMRS